jgi:hemerythrin
MRAIEDLVDSLVHKINEFHPHFCSKEKFLPLLGGNALTLHIHTTIILRYQKKAWVAKEATHQNSSGKKTMVTLARFGIN